MTYYNADVYIPINDAGCNDPLMVNLKEWMRFRANGTIQGLTRESNIVVTKYMFWIHFTHQFGTEAFIHVFEAQFVNNYQPCQYILHQQGY